MKKAAYLLARHVLSAEERAGLRAARLFGATPLRFDSLKDAHALLQKFSILWWHYDAATTLPTSALDVEHRDILRSYVEGGGTLLLSLLAAQYVCDLGFEPARPNLVTRTPWKEHSWTRKYPDIRGLAGFRGHPLFDGLHGAAYTWTAIKGRPFSAAVYDGKVSPAMGNVVAVERQYIRLNEHRKIVTEYRPGKGMVLTIGTHFFFSDPADRFRPHLEKLTENCLSGSPRSSASPRTYWPGAPTGDRREDSASRAPAVPPLPNKIPESGQSMVRTQPTRHPFDVGGRRILIMGREQTGIEEVWVHPVRVLQSLRARLTLPGRRPVELTRLKPRLTVRPESLTRAFQIGRGTLSETTFGDPSSPAGAVLYRLHGLPGAQLTISGSIDLRIMWPLPASATTGLVYGWDHGLNAVRVRNADGTLAALAGTGRVPDEIRLSARQGRVRFTLSYTLNNETSGLAWCFAGSGTDAHDAETAFRRMLNDPLGSCARQARNVRRLFRSRTRLTSPDPRFNEAYRWALAGTARFLASTPGLGTSLMAGYGTTARGWDGGQRISGRPGYAWYFGRDSVWTALALLGAGDHEAGKNVLQFLGSHQDITGKIPHEVTSSGHVHYDAADATPLFVLLMGRYLRASGDRAFIRNGYAQMRQAIAFCLSTDTDGDHLIENTGVGHGWVEGGALFPVHAELYLNACWSAALAEAAYCAEHTGHPGDAVRWQREAARVRRIIEREFWDEKKGFYDFGKWADGSFDRTRTVMAAVLLALTACPPERAAAVMKELGSERFTTPWGTRIVGSDSRLYHPSGYHYGSVWPLFTGWASLAAFHQGNQPLGFRLLQCMTRLHTRFSAGFIPEVLHGERCIPVGVCSHQAWSESMVVQPMLEGMLGMQIDACTGTLTLHPWLPAGWNELRVDGIAIGARRLDMVLRRETEGARCIFTLTRGGRVRVVLHGGSERKLELVVAAGRKGDVRCEM